MSEVVSEVHTASKAAYSVNDFCHVYSIGRTLFYDEVAAGRLRVRKVGKKTLVLASDGEAWANSLPEGSNQ